MSKSDWRTIWRTRKPRVTVAAVLYEGACASAAQTAAALARICHDHALSYVAGDTEHPLWPISPTSAQSIASDSAGELERLNRADTWARFESIGTPARIKRRDAIEHPQLTILLSARHLIEDEPRAALIKSLSSVTSSAAALILIFIAERRDARILELSAERARTLISGFESITPCRTAMYLTVPAVDGGRPIADDAHAQALALCLLNDLICDPEYEERWLIDEPGVHRGTLGVLGLKAVCYSPSAMADAYCDHLVRALLDDTSCAPIGGDTIDLTTIPGPFDVAAHIIGEEVSESASVESLGAVEGPPLWSDTLPYLSGRDTLHDRYVSGAVLLESQGFEVDLDRLPIHQWIEAIYTWDFIHRREVITNWLARVKESAIGHADRIMEMINDRIAGRLKARPSLPAAVKSLRRGAHEVRESFALREHSAQPPELRPMLERLHEAIQDTPNLSGVMARIAVLLLVQIVFGAAIFNHPAVPWKAVILAGAGAVAVGTIIVPIMRWFAAKAAVDQARRAAVQSIEARCRVDANRRIADAVGAFADRVAAHLTSCADTLEYMFGELTPKTAAAPGSEDEAAEAELSEFIFRHLPSPGRAEEMYAEAASGALDSHGGNLREHWMSHAAGAFASSIRRDDPVAAAGALDIAETARSMSWRTLRDRFRDHSLRSFIPADAEPLSPGREAVEWLLDAGTSQRLFFDGPFATFRAGSGRNVEHLLLPRELLHVDPREERLPVLWTPLMHILARIARVQLAETREEDRP